MNTKTTEKNINTVATATEQPIAKTAEKTTEQPLELFSFIMADNSIVTVPAHSRYEASKLLRDGWY